MFVPYIQRPLAIFCFLFPSAHHPPHPLLLRRSETACQTHQLFADLRFRTPIVEEQYLINMKRVSVFCFRTPFVQEEYLIIMNRKSFFCFRTPIVQEEYLISMNRKSVFCFRTPIVQEEYLINMNRKSWAETPSAVKDDYGEEYFNAFLQNMTHQMKRARPNVDEVVDLMVTAVCVDKPRHRYVPYWRSYVRSLFLGNCPAFVTDKLFQVSDLCSFSPLELKAERRARYRACTCE